MTAPQSIPDLALQVLLQTSAPEQQRLWRSVRDECRGILRACRCPEAYAESGESSYDLQFLTDTLLALLPEVEEWEPWEYDWRQSEFVASGRGG